MVINFNLMKMNPFHFLFVLLATVFLDCTTGVQQTEEMTDRFPDGTPIPDWFRDTTKIDLASLGKIYDISAYGAVADDSTVLNTNAIQQVIDLAAGAGGGVILVPKGIYKSGALFFKPGTHLHVAAGGILKGSDDISDYPIQPSRMEGQNLDYFPALINAYGVDGFSISGRGTIDGNGLKFWKAFWQRREENPKCTNLEVSRPRLVFIWNSDHVQIQDIRLQNAGFWTTHLYQCSFVKIIDAFIFAPREPVKAPSTDAIDLDVCANVLIKGCYISVNDDAIALKGGKGPWADEDPDNGSNTNILIEDITFGFCHSTFTCGSENIHTRNVLVRNCTVDNAQRLLFLKMRPDTPQKYEYITLEHFTGKVQTGIFIRPWTQFFDLQGRATPPASSSENITLRNIRLETNRFAEVGIREHDQLVNFKLEQVHFTSGEATLDTALFQGIELVDVTINGAAWYGGPIHALLKGEQLPVTE